LFGGGGTYGDYIYSEGFSYYSTVDAYDKSLTRTTPIGLSQARYALAATKVGNYALFAGGTYQTYTGTTIVDAYDTSLTRTNPTGLLRAKFALAATSIGNHALFGGGLERYSSSAWNVAACINVDAYDTSLTRTMLTNLSEARCALAATSVGTYALFSGGAEYENVDEYFSNVDAYDISLTKTNPTGLSQARSALAATTISDYALFAGGQYDFGTDDNSAIVDAYDTSLTRTTPTGLSQARRTLTATSVGEYALFSGGNDPSRSNCYSTVEAYIVI
jgi:hypothetical protein